MNRFSYVRASDVGEAVKEIAGDASAKLIAGGTNLIDLIKYDVERPTRLVDITHLPLRTIDDSPDGGLRISALATNTDVACDPRIGSRYPLLASAILAGASPQLRNAASTGGNLLQRTRCSYFYDVVTACNKREPGAGCQALLGFNRNHAILGASAACIATHPSDMCVALAALEARVRVEGPHGERTVPFGDFHRLPGESPQTDTNLRPDEIILSVDLPAEGFPKHHTYLKLRDRHSYAFALVSVAVGLRMTGERINEARLALGGVAHKPWRDQDAESMLRGEPPKRHLFQAMADHVLKGARGHEHNAFKVELARRAIVRALSQAAAGAPQSQSDKRIH